MAIRRILADACFDGEAVLGRGPVLVTIDAGVIARVERVPPGTPADIAGRFLMPGFVEAHAHMFLDGALVDAEARTARLAATHADMLATARGNLGKCTRAGVTVVRDAGDRYGVNHALRDELAEQKEALIAVRSPGAALKRAKRYGAFIGADVADDGDIRSTVAERCRGSDDIKIILTGIVDFAEASVKGAPQFDVDELSLIVAEAHTRGRKTFVHCSGAAGLAVAVAAGVDSIEHGYFMTRDILAQMAGRQIAWVPTFAPVHFQRAEPWHAGWDQATVANLSRILEDHATHVALAHDLGVPVLAGSDAGSPGVEHGTGLIDELLHLRRAGLPMAAVLQAATTRPRVLWGMDSARIAPGNYADLILLDASPFDHPAALRAVRYLLRGECCVAVSTDESGKVAGLPADGPGIRPSRVSPGQPQP